MGNVPRHIQLKTLRRGGKRDDYTLNLRLAQMPSGCVVVIEYDPVTLEVGPFLWFGGAPGEPLPDLGSKVAQRTKGNAQGEKLPRPGHRVVRRSGFERIATTQDLLERPFGPPGSMPLSAAVEPEPTTGGSEPEAARSDPLSGLALIRMALEARRRKEPFGFSSPDWLARVQGGEWQAIPPDLTYEASADLAHVIDGYWLLEHAGLGEAAPFLEARMAETKCTGEWTGSALELWVVLFLQHRADRQAGEYANPADPLRDALCRQLRAQLIAEEDATQIG